jgi:transcriptional antiterminator RfaH
MATTERLWYLVQLKPNALDVARQNLERQGFETFAPMIEQTTRAIGRFRSACRPLFPGYLFVAARSTTSRWQPINATLGVARLVTFGKSPARVPSALIDEIRSRCDAGDRLVVHDKTGIGDRVRLRRGSFAEMLGTVESLDAEQRVWVLIDVLGRQTRVLADHDTLERA